MSVCTCDGPPHAYDPAWCGRGRLVPERSNSCPPTDTGFVVKHRTRAGARRPEVIQRAEAWERKLRDDAHWARTREIRDEKQAQADILRALVAAADVEIRRQS